MNFGEAVARDAGDHAANLRRSEREWILSAGTRGVLRSDVAAQHLNYTASNTKRRNQHEQQT